MALLLHTDFKTLPRADTKNQPGCAIREARSAEGMTGPTECLFTSARNGRQAPVTVSTSNLTTSPREG